MAPPCADLEEGRQYYWNTITSEWVMSSGPRCTDTVPAYVLRGNGRNIPDQLVVCPSGLNIMKTHQYIKDMKESYQQNQKGKNRFIDLVAVSPPVWMLEALLETTKVGGNNPSTFTP